VGTAGSPGMAEHVGIAGSSGMAVQNMWGQQDPLEWQYRTCGDSRFPWNGSNYLLDNNVPHLWRQ
jgi:hypothetical protein